MDEMKKLAALAYELREDVVNMVVEGKGGHIGGDMSVMESADRDRFIMSKGHSVEAYYAVLARKGFFQKKR